MRIIIYTSAPQTYDYATTQMLGVVATQRKGATLLRKVSVPDDKVDYQVARYQSGFCLVADEAQMKRLVDVGLVEFI